MKKTLSKISLGEQARIENTPLLNQRSDLRKYVAATFTPSRRGIYLPFFYPSFIPLNCNYILQNRANRKIDSVIYVNPKTNGSLPFMRPTLPHYKFQTRRLSLGININPFHGFTFLEGNPKKVEIFKKEGLFETKFKQKYSNDLGLKLIK